MIFFSNYTQVDIASQGLKRLGYNGAKLLILLDDTRLKSAGAALEGAIVAERPDPSREFIKKYQDEYGEFPGIATDTSYDVLNAYVYAMNKAKSVKTSDVLKVYKNLEYQGVNQKIVFDQDGGVSAKPVFKEVRDVNGIYKKVLY